MICHVRKTTQWKFTIPLSSHVPAIKTVLILPWWPVVELHKLSKNVIDFFRLPHLMKNEEQFGLLLHWSFEGREERYFKTLMPEGSVSNYSLFLVVDN